MGRAMCVPESCLDLVALATVADIVPLQDENRILVREGLTQITQGARCGDSGVEAGGGHHERPVRAKPSAFALAHD